MKENSYKDIMAEIDDGVALRFIDANTMEISGTDVQLVKLIDLISRVVLHPSETVYLSKGNLEIRIAHKNK